MSKLRFRNRPGLAETLSARWTLRRRLVVTVVALMAAVSIVIAAVSVIALQGFLQERLDSQLHAAIGRSQSGFGPTPDGDALNGQSSTGRLAEAFNRQAPGTVVAVIANGVVSAAVKNNAGVQRDLTINQINTLFAGSLTTEPSTVTIPGLGDYRFVAATFTNGDRIFTGLSLADVTATVSQLVLVIALVSAGGLIAAGLAALLVVRVALRPLQRVVATATHVAELPLDRGEVALAVRVPDIDADPRTEVGQVGAAINRMLGHVATALTSRQASENKVRQFVADASHELRTPLASIRGYAELTRRGGHELPDDVVYSLSRVESEATRMTSLVEDLLLLARLDEGRDLESAPLDLTRLLIDALSDAHAAGPDHEWSLDLPEEPVMVAGDVARLHQVFANLLTNARVHTPAKTTVEAAVSLVGSTAVVTITDNGPGIPLELQPVLFERFARGDSSRSRAAGSTGLGLAIVSAVIEGHRGTVSVDSEPGRTAFTVTLPLA